MKPLNVSPTKSNLLVLKHRLSVAEEGYDLLDEKRRILVFELVNLLKRAREAEEHIEAASAEAFIVLREASLDSGSLNVDRAALAVRMDHEAVLSERRLMGLFIPRVAARIAPMRIQFGFAETSSRIDDAMHRFVDLLPLLAEFAELENAVIRLAAELRKTQRRCNALSKVFIPSCRETISFIASALEERERDALITLKFIHGRQREA